MIIIGNTSIDSLISGGATAVGGSDPQPAGSAQSGPGSDSVSLSNAGSLAGLAKITVAPEHQAKLQGIASQVQAGQYQTNNAEIGSGLIAHHLQR